MSAIKIAITIEQSLLRRLDQLVRNKSFQNRSKDIQLAVDEKLTRMDRTRLAKECFKLDKKAEQKMAEESE